MAILTMATLSMTILTMTLLTMALLTRRAALHADGRRDAGEHGVVLGAAVRALPSVWEANLPAYLLTYSLTYLLTYLLTFFLVACSAWAAPGSYRRTRSRRATLRASHR